MKATKVLASSAPEVLLRQAREALAPHQYRFSCEADLHEGLAIALDAIGLVYEREADLFCSGLTPTTPDRVDFLVEEVLALEVKVGGAYYDVLRQLSRYSRARNVGAVLLVTSRRYHLQPDFPERLNGKPVAGLLVNGGIA